MHCACQRLSSPPVSTSGVWGAQPKPSLRCAFALFSASLRTDSSVIDFSGFWQLTFAICFALRLKNIYPVHGLHQVALDAIAFSANSFAVLDNLFASRKHAVYKVSKIPQCRPFPPKDDNRRRQFIWHFAPYVSQLPRFLHKQKVLIPCKLPLATEFLPQPFYRVIFVLAHRSTKCSKRIAPMIAAGRIHTSD